MAPPPSPQHRPGRVGSLVPMPGYESAIDPASDSTHAKVVRLVGSGKRVLELGCSSGYMSRVLVERGCQVVGIEIAADQAALAASICERVIVGDLDRLNLAHELGGDTFDVVVAADVLEHLKDPLAVLSQLRRHLRPGGYVVASIPNVAHGSVRLALLAGQFPYNDRGLLDNTHLRFFTRDSLFQLFEDAGFVVEHLERQLVEFRCSEVPHDLSGFPQEVLDTLERDIEARTYQFIVAAYPCMGVQAAKVHHPIRVLMADLEEVRRQLRETRLELATARRQLAEQSAELEASRREVQDLREQLKRVMNWRTE